MNQSKLKEHIHYCPESGVFTWLRPTGDRVRAGYRAGWKVRTGGYRAIRLFGKIYFEHRLAWLYVYGEIPMEVDHINMNKEDNRIENLRQVTRSQNKMNVGLTSANKTGKKGVSFDNVRGGFSAKIKLNGKTINLGRFKDIDSAHEAYKEASKKYHGSFGRVE